MRRRALRTVFVALAACGHPEPPPTATATASATATTSAAPVASGAPETTGASDAGDAAEDLARFAGAELVDLPGDRLPADQRVRADGKTGATRLASVSHPSLAGLATFGLVTAIDSAGERATAQWFVRSDAATKLAHAAPPAVAFATYSARFSPAPTPSLLVLEDSAHGAVAVRFLAVTLDVVEAAVFADAPAFFVRRLEDHAWGFDDKVDLDVIAYRGGELTRVLSVYLGFRDVSPCDSGHGTKTLGPPGSVEIVARGARPVLRVREAAPGCDNPVKVSEGCAGVVRDYAWDAASKRFVPQGAGTRVTLAAKPKGC